jgi:magnesium transporter
MIRSLYFENLQSNSRPIGLQEIPAVLENPDGLLWLDFFGESDQTCEPILRDQFHFHPLAIDDALRESHVPKIDDWEKYLYIVLDALSFDPHAGEIESAELDVFLGNNYIVTLHDLPIHALERVWITADKDDRHHRMGADHILYKLADELVNDYMRTVDELDFNIEQLEDQILAEPSNEMVQRIFTFRRATLHLRRSVSPLREVFNKLARDDYAMIDARDQVYFRDVYDHLVRLHDISESLRDLSGGALDTYLSVVNNRMSEIMKTLAIVTTLFMPISFLAGVFGMNFFLPETPITAWMELPVFYLVLVLFILIPAAIFWWVRRSGWM